MKIGTLLLTLVTLALLPTWVAAEEAFDYTYLDVTYLDNGLDGTTTADEGQDRIAVNIGAGDGMGLRTSFALTDNVHVFAGYSGSNMDLNATQTVPYPTLDQMRDAMFATDVNESWDQSCDLNDDGMVNFQDLEVLANADGDTRVAQQVAADGELTTWRLGMGYNQMLRPKIGAYGQLFLDIREIEHDSIAFAGGRDFDANASGIGATFGLQGKMTSRLELEGWVTYSPVGEVDMLGRTDDDMLQDETLIGLGGEFWVTDNASIFAQVEGYSDIRAWSVGTRMGFGG